MYKRQELGFTWEPSAHWRWNNDLTLLHTRDRDSNTPLLDRPRRTWNSQLRWMLADWQAQVAMQWVGDQVTSGQIELPGYRVFNARVQRRINAQLSWHVGIENFTNLRLADESPNLSLIHI